MASPSFAPQRWLFGPIPDLLLGCGALYILLFAVFVFAGEWWVAALPLWLAPLLVLVLSLPHYGATLLRVYEHRTDRRAYALFSVHATIVLVFAFIAGAYNATIGSILLTIYLTWSPWHYTGQNYGLAVMFLRRRGVPMVGATKRWLYASFLFCYGLTFCVIHESSLWAAARSLPQDVRWLRFMPIGIPAADVLVPVLTLGWAVATIGALRMLLRQARASDLLPVGLLVLTQALWFAVPGVALYWNLFSGVAPLDPQTLGALLVWIALGHAVQYLWVTAYYARAARDWSGALPYFGKTLAAGALVYTLPVALFASDALGGPSYEMGLAFLVASVVNIHHFILDGAIWKLRDSRIAKVLIQSGASADDEDVPRVPGLRVGTWSLATACLLAAFFVFAKESWLLPRALDQGNAARSAFILDQLAWLGRDSASRRAATGWLYVERGKFEPALTQFERSAYLVPLAETWGDVALMRAQLGDVEGSVRAQERALALAPQNDKLFEWVALLSERIGRPERAASVRERRPAEGGGAAAAPDLGRKAALY